MRVFIIITLFFVYAHGQVLLEELLIEKRLKHNIHVGVVIPYVTNEPKRTEMLNIMSTQKHGEDIVLVNDGGSMFTGFTNVVHHIVHVRHKPIGKSVMQGYEWLYNNGYNIICNLDSDVLVNQNWLSRSVSLVQQYPDYVISAFNEANHLKHCVVKSFSDHYIKNCGGGIHYCFTRTLYEDFIRPALQDIETHGNLNYWDAGLVERMQSSNRFVVSPKPSLVQHIGYIGFTASYGKRPFWQYAPDYKLSSDEVNLIKHIPQLRVLYNMEEDLKSTAVGDS